MEITNNSRKAAKPDMTPLVDLGFLLITFFMYTTTFSTPNMFTFVQPHADGKAPIKLSNTLTFVLGENNELYYHQAEVNKIQKEDLLKVDFSTNAIGKLLVMKRNSANKVENFTVIIKPSAKSTYKNLVDILDEMMIFNQGRYTIDELSANEMHLLAEI